MNYFLYILVSCAITRNTLVTFSFYAFFDNSFASLTSFDNTFRHTFAEALLTMTLANEIWEWMVT